VLEPVETTALGVALLRAIESERPDRLFDDPYAARFAGSGDAVELDGWAARVAHSVAVRTRFYDDYLIGAGLPQVVLLAAGLDSRAWRLPWLPGSRLFEVDLPGVLALKAATIDAEPRCERHVVVADLRGDWATVLTSEGFDPATPTAWLAEGLLIYLTSDEVERLLSTITGLAAPDSRLSFENVPPHDLPPPEVRAMWTDGYTVDTVGWLSIHGWRAERQDRDAFAAAVGRPSPVPSAGAFVMSVRETR